MIREIVKKIRKPIIIDILLLNESFDSLVTSIRNIPKILVKAFFDPIIGATVLFGLPLAQAIHYRYLRIRDIKPEPPELQLLVEAHGLIYDIIFFGILMVFINNLIERRRKIERYKEELNDYRGWTREEAGYRVAGLIKRLKAELVEDINFNALHLGRCPKEIVEKAVKAKAHIISLEKANLWLTNLQGARLFKTNLQEANLPEANLQEANLKGAKLQGAIVGEVDWIEKLKEWGVRGAEDIEARLYVDKTPKKNTFNQTYYTIKEKPIEENNNTRGKCKAIAVSTGKRCENYVKKGFDRCYQHLTQDEQ